MEVVIEIVEPGRRAPSIKKFQQTEILVGRAWDCDLVIADTEVDARHMRISLDPEQESFSIEDLGSANGVRVHKQRLQGSGSASFGETLTIGQTTFRVHRTSDSVAEVKIHSATEQALKQLGNPFVAILLAALALFVLKYSQFLGSGARFEWNDQLSDLISLATSLVIWAIVWGGITKLLKHELRIWAHLGLASIILILSVFLNEFESFMSFNLLSPAMSELFQAINFSLMIFIWVVLGLIITANVKQKTRMISAGALVSLFLLTSFLLPRIKIETWVFLIPLETQSLPPALLASAKQPQESFIQNIEDNIKLSEQRALEARAKALDEAQTP